MGRDPGVVKADGRREPAFAAGSFADERTDRRLIMTGYDKLCNLAPSDVAELRLHIWHALTVLKNQPQLLISFVLHARVPLLLR